MGKAWYHFSFQSVISPFFLLVQKRTWSVVAPPFHIPAFRNRLLLVWATWLKLLFGVGGNLAGEHFDKRKEFSPHCAQTPFYLFFFLSFTNLPFPPLLLGRQLKYWHNPCAHTGYCANLETLALPFLPPFSWFFSNRHINRFLTEKTFLLPSPPFSCTS